MESQTPMAWASTRADELAESRGSRRAALEHLVVTPKLTTRFWAKVDRNGPVHPVLGTRCWVWMGPKTEGYGWISVPELETHGSRTHRLAWVLTHGRIPPGEGHHGTCVLHRCDNRTCVNPEHLFLGTQADNMADRAAKGRAPRGEKHRSARLTEDSVRAIRKASAAGISQYRIAKLYRVARTTIEGVVTRRNWGHVTDASSYTPQLSLPGL